ncbi:MAG: hypothetical protein WD929_07370, partial [Steroidobacteraceae bacterium]
MRLWLASLMLVPALAAAQGSMRIAPEAQRLNAMAARFAPVDLRVELKSLPASEREALAHLIRAARVVDALFMRQAWAGNEALLLKLMEDDSIVGRAR